MFPSSLVAAQPATSRMQQHPMVAFFASTYVLSWAIWTPLVIFRDDLPEGPRILLMLLGSLVPSAVGLFLTARLAGRAGLRELRRRLLMSRIGLRWCAAVVVLPLLVPLSVWISIQLGGDAPAVHTTILTVAVIFAFSIFPGSALGEELGWRGLALPRLQAHHSALNASLIVGILWGLWHLPLYLAGFDTRPLSVFPAFVVAVTALSIVCTWMYNGTGGSLMVVVLFHAAANLPITILLQPLGARAVQPFLIYVALMVLTAAVITLATGSSTLSRTRLRVMT